MELLSQQAAVSVLFFSRDAYEKAIRGLADSEINAIVDRRRQYWAPNAVGHGLNWLYHIARRCLTLTALAVSSPGSAARLEDPFEQCLQLLVSITGETRYQDMSMASLLVLVVEGEAELYREYLDARDEARRVGDSPLAEKFTDAAKRSESYGQALGLSLKSLGRPEFTQGLPYIGLSRGVFIWPKVRDLIEMLTVQREVYVTWKDGLVANWSLDDLPELERRGKSVRILYFNGGQLLTDAKDLTAAQLEREFAERFEAGRGASMDARREHLYSLWLEQHLLRRKALAQASAQDTSLAAILAQEVTEEARAMREELATHPVWSEKRDKIRFYPFVLERDDLLATLKKCGEQLVQDARFLAELCRRDNNKNGEALFLRISAFKPAQP